MVRALCILCAFRHSSHIVPAHTSSCLLFVPLPLHTHPRSFPAAPAPALRIHYRAIGGRTTLTCTKIVGYGTIYRTANCHPPFIIMHSFGNTWQHLATPLVALSSLLDFSSSSRIGYSAPFAVTIWFSSSASYSSTAITAKRTLSIHSLHHPFFPLGSAPLPHP